MREADWGELEALDRRRESYDSASWAASRPYLDRDRDGQTAVEARLLEAEDTSGLKGAMYSSVATRDYDAVTRIAELLPSPVWPGDLRRRMERQARYASLLAGRWVNEEGGDCAPGPPRSMRRAVCALIPFLAVPEEDLLELRKRAAAWDSVPAPEGEDAGASDPQSEASPDEAEDSDGSSDPGIGLRPQGRLYVLGALAARMGEPEVALAAADRIDAMPTEPRWRPTVGSLARTLRAEVALRDGRPDDALALMEVPTEGPPPELANHPLFARELERLWHAEALYAAGRDEEALRWYENAFGYSYLEDVFLPYTTLRRAEILDRLGRAEEAAEAYSRFLELWPDPDPELHPLLEDARDRLAALRSEG